MSLERNEALNPHDIKFIYFDLGNVVFKFEGGLQALSDKTGLELEECNRIWANLDESICRGLNPPQEIWNQIKQQSGFTGRDINLVEFWVKHFVSNDEVHEEIRKLANNYEIGLLTNIYPGVLDLAFEKRKIPIIKYSTVVLSSDIGFVKPSKEIYQIAEKVAGVKPGEILFIDDLPAYIDGANNQGWQTFLFEKDNPKKAVKNLEIALSAD